jgi:hypothetical protein
MHAFYGNPDRNGDGVPDRAWEDANLAKLVPPYRMVLAWDTSKPVSTIRVHRKCIESLDGALNDIAAHYGSQAAIEAARLHLFGGCYAFRLKRGGSTLSNHSWASAIDLDPERNGIGKTWKPNSGMMPIEVVRIFEARGWVWGGLWKTPDAMHFQAATIRSS